MVDYIISFRKPFSDLRKLFIGIIASFVPIVNWISFGYILESSDIKKDGQTGMMAEWGNLQEMLVKGFKGYLVQFIYSIPLILIYLIIFFVYIVPTFIRIMESMKFDYLVALSSNSASPSLALEITNIMRNEVAPMILNSLIDALPFLIIFLFLFLIIWYFLPVAILNYYRNDSMDEAFNFSSIKKYAITKKYFNAWIIFFVLNLIYHAISFLPMALLLYNPLLFMRLSNGFSILPTIIYFIINMISFSIIADAIKEIDRL
ncbi:MAG: DUF4013 domain-containing protein [Candidatus Methanofastidiosa archaeon]|jgi:hypothetical protein|nr:DUF4013 domain-containing protein [Candidatus Methanofastidiosa archaeon]